MWQYVGTRRGEKSFKEIKRLVYEGSQRKGIQNLDCIFSG